MIIKHKHSEHVRIIYESLAACDIQPYDTIYSVCSKIGAFHDVLDDYTDTDGRYYPRLRFVFADDTVGILSYNSYRIIE